MMYQNSVFCATNNCASLSNFTRKELIYLCDRLVFEHEPQLRDYEIKALSRISMRYQGKATDRELSMIADICDRVGIAGGVL